LKGAARPSTDDVEVFRSLIKGTKVLLLGSTIELWSLATVAYDLHPKYPYSKIQDRSWLSVDERFDTVIGDGIFSFGADLNYSLLETYRRWTDRLVARCFNGPPPNHKYATSWPTIDEFVIRPELFLESKLYNFYVWNFK